MLKNASIRFIQEACFGVNTNWNRPLRVSKNARVSRDVWMV